jgi:hypothetical protein
VPKGGVRRTSWKPGDAPRRGKGPRQLAIAAGLPPPMSPAEFTALCRRLAPDAIKALEAAMQNKGERTAAAKVLLERGFGQPVARVEMTGADGGAIKVEDNRPRPETFLAEWIGAVPAGEKAADKEIN